VSLPASSITAMFDGWKTDVLVKRSGGRDAKGDPTPGSEHTLPNWLIVPSESSEPIADRAEDASTSAVGYGEVGADVKSTDRVIVPAGHLMAGTYEVNGDPAFYPLGTVVGLRRA